MLTYLKAEQRNYDVPVSRSLRCPDTEIIKALEDVKRVHTVSASWRSNTEDEFVVLFQSAVSPC